MKTYTVRAGDTLTSIARKTLGSGNAWRLLAQANGISNPGAVRVGQVLQLPIQEYRVQRGDTLMAIARKTLGDGSRWQAIAELNQITASSPLRVGMMLKIPLEAAHQESDSSPSPAPQPSPSPTPQPISAGSEPGNSAHDDSASANSAPTYRVQPGDTLASIARKTLGDGNRWREIAQLNQIQNPRDIRVGMELKLPKPGQANPSPMPSSPSPVPVPVPVPAPAPPQPPTITARTYTVQPGDSLIKIAEKTLGDRNRWREIAQLNNITSTRDLQVGMVLKIPTTVGTATPSPTPSPELAPVPVPAPAEQPYQTYTVQPGDSLIKIAEKTLGDRNRWREIARLNDITSTRALQVGMVLKIPQSSIPLQPSPEPIAGTVPLPLPPVVPLSDNVGIASEAAYQVQPGDSLSSIAEKTLGDRNRWKELGLLNDIADPSKLRVGGILRLPQAEAVPFEVVTVLNGMEGKQLSKRETVRFERDGDDVFANWLKRDFKERVGVVYRQGLFRRGTQHPRDFIAEAQPLLTRSKLSVSEMNAIAAIADNEAYLDGINTWDGQYLSFGMFQWTAGGSERPGELSALLSRLKQNEIDEFRHYFGQFGLDVEGSDGVRGWLSLNGTRLVSDYQKSILRQPRWAYRFAIAGTDPIVQATEVLHAVDRIDKFYFVRQSSLDGYSLSRLITSEYGVALLLDTHVNRPSYVAPAFAEALWQLGMTPLDLSRGTTADEKRALARFLKVRQTYGSKPMTHAKYRGDRILRQVKAGRLSQERGSFVSNRSQRS